MLSFTSYLRQVYSAESEWFVLLWMILSYNRHDFACHLYSPCAPLQTWTKARVGESSQPWWTCRWALMSFTIFDLEWTRKKMDKSSTKVYFLCNFESIKARFVFFSFFFSGLCYQNVFPRTQDRFPVISLLFSLTDQILIHVRLTARPKTPTRI